ncbi:hypothetical protein LIA77_06013 [Sarocladium implicatum]|nr:hypothetical protein LIA77_06013 [Sarocladium implicatum]
MPPPRWHRDSASPYRSRSSLLARTSSPLSFGETVQHDDAMDASLPMDVTDAPNGATMQDDYEIVNHVPNGMQDTAPGEDYPGLMETPTSEIPTDPMLTANTDDMMPEYYDEQQPTEDVSQMDIVEEPAGEIPIDPAMIDPALMAGTPGQRASEPRASNQAADTASDKPQVAEPTEDGLMQDVAQADFARSPESKEVKVEGDAESEDNVAAEVIVNGIASDSPELHPESGDNLPPEPADDVPAVESIQESTSPPIQKSSSPRITRSSPRETRAKLAAASEVKAEAKSSDSISNSASASQTQEQDKEPGSTHRTPKQSTTSEITTRSSAQKGSSSPEMTRTTRRSKAAQEQADLAAHVRQRLAEKPPASTPLKNEQSEKASSETEKQVYRPQPRPTGRWSHLTPYVDGEFSIYPEKKVRSDDETNGDDQSPEDKDDKEPNDMEPMVEDNDDAGDAQVTEAPTPALNTPRRGSPVPDSGAITAFGSPAPAVAEDGDDDSVSDSDEPEKPRHFRYRKLRDAEEYITALENYEDMSTADLYAVLEAINVSMVQWQTEWTGLGKQVDDYENALRRRAADTKYESRTRNLHQHNFNYEEPDFAVKGYKAKEKEVMSETRYLQAQDRIMASTYGFAYDPHPSKIGKQNPDLQQEGMVTRGRMLRNHPRQTVKASEGDEPTGKRQRKPVQLFDPATQEASRSSTPVPTRGRRRKTAAAEADEIAQPVFTSSVNGNASEEETVVRKTRRRRRTKAEMLEAAELAQAASRAASPQEEQTRSVRRGRGRPATRYDDTYTSPSGPDKGPEVEDKVEKEEPRRHMLTLKIPKGKAFDDAASAMTDNGDSRPSTASSEASNHTAESSYSFRPKRQKRFRDEPEESPTAVSQGPPKKRRNRTSGAVVIKEAVSTPTTNNSEGYTLDGSVAAMPSSDPFVTETPQTASAGKKAQKIKVVKGPQADTSRYGTPTTLMSFNSEDGDEPPKDYKSMTKSEKMSASMKSRWANGNMAGAVEKRKATLAAKKAAQAAAEARVGAIAPKPQTAKRAKKEAADQHQHQQQQSQQHPHHQHIQPQQHHHHHHQHPPPPQHMQHMQPIQPHSHHPHHQPLQPHPPPGHQQQQPPGPPGSRINEAPAPTRFQGFPSRFHAFIANPWGPPPGPY